MGTNDNIISLVLDTMKRLNRPLKPGEIAKEINMDSKEVSKIISKLKKDGLIDSPKRCFYQAK